MSFIFLIIPAVIIGVLFLSALVGIVVVLIIQSSRKKSNSTDAITPAAQPSDTMKSLGTVLKENRIRCNMTQEYVAEQLEVSRQAVSKWENGTSDPSTSNLIALSKLYQISPEELLRDVSK